MTSVALVKEGRQEGRVNGKKEGRNFMFSNLFIPMIR